jgi:hypothetical protein
MLDLIVPMLRVGMQPGTLRVPCGQKIAAFGSSYKGIAVLLGLIVPMLRVGMQPGTLRVPCDLFCRCFLPETKPNSYFPTTL